MTSAAAASPTTGPSPLLGKCLFFLRTAEKAITTANMQQEVNFGVLDCSGGGGVLNSLETLLTHIMLPALRSQQTRMLEHIPSLMNGIKMIHVVSQYYNTSERMSSLLLKVTNQMISTCRSYLLQGMRRVWEHSRPVLLQRISDCCNLNAAYQRSFHSVRDKLRENPENRQFDFSENYIFGKFDSFCRRLEKMADMASTLENLAALQSMKVDDCQIRNK
nr:dynein heavy chain 5, axonemal [Maylandia zebra]